MILVRKNHHHKNTVFVYLRIIRILRVHVYLYSFTNAVECCDTVEARRKHTADGAVTIRPQGRRASVEQERLRGKEPSAEEITQAKAHSKQSRTSKCSSVLVTDGV